MTTDILDKFTNHLKNVLAKAYTLATETGSRNIGPEHLLLALLLQKGSIGGEALRKARLSSEEIRRAIHFADRIAEHKIRREEKDIKNDSTPKLSNESKRAIEKAVLTANIHEHKYVGTEHLLAGILEIAAPTIEAMLIGQEVDVQTLKEQTNAILESTSKLPEITETFEKGKAPQNKEEKGDEKGSGRDGVSRPKSEKKERQQKEAKQKMPALDFFAIDLTNEKYQEKVDPVIGRDEEIERLVQIICRRNKNNPVLLGEPGVGKTAIIEGLAKKIMEGNVPEALIGKRILSLDLGLMLAGTIYRGEFEGRIKQIVDEVKQNPDIILFIDELHNIMGTGATSGSLDAANLLKPALARGDMRCIGATTLAEYKKHIEVDSALERRFQSIIVEPPSPELAITILKGLRSNYESHHHVTINDEAITSAVYLSERFLTDRFLPDKALDLIDEAASALRVAAMNKKPEIPPREKCEQELEDIRIKKENAVHEENFIEALELKRREKELEQQLNEEKIEQPKTKQHEPVGIVGKKEIARIIERAIGIPASELISEEKDRLLHLEKKLSERVIGQKEAVDAVSDLIRRAKSGISNPNRPLASFLFLGPSGVGKTELAKAVAEIVFHDPNALLRIDMSEMAEGFSTSKLLGAPAGYVGYRDGTKFTDIIKRKPYSLVLFDELEKAHGDVHNLLLQILEDGHLTDATGKKINFKNTVIVMTSNVGANVLHTPHVGFETEQNEMREEAMNTTVRHDVLKELERSFRPEFINRIDRIINFNPLGAEALEHIVLLQLNELKQRLLNDFDTNLTIKPEVITAIARSSYNPLYGARTVRRHIQDHIENPLARVLLAETPKPGSAFVISNRDNEFVIKKSRANTPIKA